MPSRTRCPPMLPLRFQEAEKGLLEYQRALDESSRACLLTLYAKA